MLVLPLDCAFDVARVPADADLGDGGRLVFPLDGADEGPLLTWCAGDGVDGLHAIPSVVGGEQRAGFAEGGIGEDRGFFDEPAGFEIQVDVAVERCHSEDGISRLSKFLLIERGVLGRKIELSQRQEYVARRQRRQPSEQRFIYLSQHIIH